MNELKGISVQGGAGIGPVRFLRRSEGSPSMISSLTPDQELLRFEAAKERAFIELKRIYASVSAHLGDNAAAIFLFQSMLLDDEEFLNTVRTCINDFGTAETAVAQAEQATVAFFDSLSDSYMRSRAADARDLTRRLDGILSDRSSGADAHTASILVSEDLAPSDLMLSGSDNLLGLVSHRGSADSHTAILARALNIPCVTGIPVSPDWDGRMAVLDGDAGVLILDPDEKTVQKARYRAACERESSFGKEIELSMKAIDGRPVFLNAAISSAWEAADAYAAGVNGVGLYRTAISHNGRSMPPSESELLKEFRDTLRAMRGRPVTLQSVEVNGIGKDTPLAPLFRTDFYNALKTQLRAALRAAAYGPVSLAFTGVESAWDLYRARQVLHACEKELTGAGEKIGTPATGSLIRSPAGIMDIDGIAEASDFLILDGDALLLSTVTESGRIPSYLVFGKMAQKAVFAAHRFRHRIALLGEELDTYPQAILPLLRLGMDDFTVPLSSIPNMRRLCQGVLNNLSVAT